MDLNEFVPYLLLLIPWGMAAREVVRGLRSGEMVEYLRRGVEVGDFEDQTSWRICQRAAEPWSFRFLFAFYAMVAAGIPVLLGYIVWRRFGVGS